MKKQHVFVAFVCFIIATVNAVTQDDLNYVAKNLKVKFVTVENVNGNDANFNARITLENNGDQNIEKDSWEIYFICLYMVEPAHLPKEDSYLIPGSSMMVAHVNGGLFKLFPSENFQTFLNGTTIDLNVVITAWSVARTDVMPRWYVTATNLQAVNIQSTDSENLEDFTGGYDSYKVWKRYSNDRYDPWNATDRGDKWTKGVTDNKSSMNLILPTPNQIILLSGIVNLPLTNWKIIYNDLSIKNDAEFCQTAFKDNYDWTVTVEQSSAVSRHQTIFLRLNPYFMPSDIDGYTLEISYPFYSSFIEVVAASSAGIYYGIQSLLSLIDGNMIENNMKLSAVKITDKARFEYRGMHVDLARNYRQPSEILELIKIMGMYKLNKLHLHLTDDEGWRLEMPWCPQLTTIGGRRCHDPEEKECIIPQFGSGATQTESLYWRGEDYKQILREANTHHVEVIPEIDMPGHTHAAIKSVDAYVAATNDDSFVLSNKEDPSQYLSVQLFTDNAVEPCKSNTYKFIENVVKTIIDYHKDIQPLKIFHLGGDEVAETAWDESPACKQLLGEDVKHIEIKDYFMTTAAEKVNNISNNLTLALWEDGVMNMTIPFERNNFPNQEVLTYNWQSIWEWGLGNRPYILANAGYKVVMCQATHLYFDHPYEPDPEERGLYWATRYTDVRKTFSFKPDDLYSNVETKRSGEPYTREQLCEDTTCVPLEKPENIVGMQGHSFSETMRTAEQFQYMIYPRVLALAERAWHKADWEESETSANMDTDFSSFVNTLGYKELRRLEHLNITYRISVPGIRVVENSIQAYAEFPGLPIQYSTSDTHEWTNYTEPFHMNGNDIKLRCTSYDRKRFSRVTQFTSEAVTIFLYKPLLLLTIVRHLF